MQACVHAVHAAGVLTGWRVTVYYRCTAMYRPLSYCKILLYCLCTAVVPQGSTYTRTAGVADPKDPKSVFKDLDLDLQLRLPKDLHDRYRMSIFSLHGPA